MIPRDWKPVNVLVVDDSPLFAEAVRTVLEADPAMNVVGIAEDGLQAVRMTQSLSPDVITMDIQMPVMNGLDAIERIMATTPTPIVVMTADPRGRSGELSFEALKRGALDLISKPSNWPATEAEAEDFRERVRLYSTIPVVRHVRGRKPSYPPPPDEAPNPPRTPPLTPPSPLVTPRSSPRRMYGARSRHLVGIVSSTGGPATLAKVLRGLPSDFPAGVVIVQHMTVGFVSSLAQWLDAESSLNVRVAQPNEAIEPGTVLVAPDGTHTTVTRDGRIRLERSAPVGTHRPSGTLLLRSIARSYGRHAIGVVLTGMGEDGAEGLKDIFIAGGSTLAQDEGTSVVYGMPRAARDNGAARLILPDVAIADALVRSVGGGR